VYARTDMHSAQKGSVYSKETSKMMAGIAIVTMITGHLFRFNGWLCDDVAWHSFFGGIGDEIVWIFSRELAVVFFSFTSGYVLYANPKAYSSLKSRFMRLVHFLISYWVTLALFLIIGLFNNDTMPTLSQLALNMFGLHTGPLQWVNVPFAWYVTYYIEFVLLVPVLIWAYKSRGKIKDTIVTICIAWVTLFVIPVITEKFHLGVMEAILGSLHPLITSCLGVVFAKYCILDKAHLFWVKFQIWGIIMIIVCIYLSCHTIAHFGLISGLEYVLKIVLISLFLEILIRLKSIRIKRILMMLGKYSLYLWFLHGIFFTGKNFLQRELYSLSDPMLILIVCIVSLLPIAYVLNKFVDWIFSFIKREYLPINPSKLKS
jgi:peptidoglycan/LPS O-acetylase OafA/YrhL